VWSPDYDGNGKAWCASTTAKRRPSAARASNAREPQEAGFVTATGPILVADGHSDLLQELVFAEQEGEENPLRSRWLVQLREGGVALQVCAIFRDPAAEGDGARDLLRQAQSFHAAVERNPEVFAIGERRSLEQVAVDRVGLVLAIEGVSVFGEDLWLLDLFAHLAVRVIGLTWNEQNAFAHGCDHAGGLTSLGEQLVDRLPGLGWSSISRTRRRRRLPTYSSGLRPARRS
jgi:hypothetical protein